MPLLPAPGEQYTIRRKVFKLFGASFHIYDEKGDLAGYCNQKAFKLREDIRIYTDESMTTPLLSIVARNIIDFSVTLDITLPTGESLGSIRRKGLSSTFFRDEWLVFNAAGEEIGTLRENGGFLAFLRHNVEIVSLISPQSFSVLDKAGNAVATIRQHFNLFIYRLGIAVKPEAEPAGFDDLFVLALGCVVASIEGRQSGG